jgi:fatty acid-binding protein DegV
MSAHICLLVDASCDLPEEILAHPQIRLLPITVKVGNNRVLDRRDPAETQNFYTINLKSPSALDAASEPPSAEEIAKFAQEELALEFDQVLGNFVSSTRSPIFERAQPALDRAKMNSFTQRVRAKKLKALDMQACDSLALFSGYGVQSLTLLDAMTAADDNVDFQTLIQLHKELRVQTYAYAVPGDVSYILKRAKAKGEKSVSTLAGLAAKTLSITPILRAHMGDTLPVARKRGADNAREQLMELANTFLERKLVLSKHLCFSYSGELTDVSAMTSYQTLVAMAKLQGITVHLCRMSMTASVNVGPNTLSLGLLAKPHEAAELV